MPATPAPRHSWSPGDVIAGRYRVTHTVGRGAMGAVYGAEHVETGQGVAVKCMLVSDADGDQFLRRFSQEARVMASLRSPNTIRIYDFGRDGGDGALYMAMELLEGVPLDARIRELQRQGKVLSEAETLQIGIQILRGLGEAHGKGLVHRDMKPGNVFLTDDGSGEVLVKVLDFGIARVADSSLTNAGNILGTPTYMSPEQWDGDELDARADLYAVGCLLYCCATGQPPYKAGDNVLSLMKKHCFSPIPDVRELANDGSLSDGFAHVVQIALAKDRAERFADAKAMREALQAVLGGAWAGTPLAQARTVAGEGTARLGVADDGVGPTLVRGRVSGVVPVGRRASPSAVAAVAADVTLAVPVADVADLANDSAAVAPRSRVVLRAAVVGVVLGAAIAALLSLRGGSAPAVPAQGLANSAPVAAVPAPTTPSPALTSPAAPAAPAASAAGARVNPAVAPAAPAPEPVAAPAGSAVDAAPKAAPAKPIARGGSAVKPSRKKANASSYNTVD